MFMHPRTVPHVGGVVEWPECERTWNNSGRILAIVETGGYGYKVRLLGADGRVHRATLAVRNKLWRIV